MDLIQDYNETLEDTAIPSHAPATIVNEIRDNAGTSLLTPQHFQYTIVDNTPQFPRDGTTNTNQSELSSSEVQLQTIEMMVEENNQKTVMAPGEGGSSRSFNTAQEIALHLNQGHATTIGNLLIEFEIVINDGSNESSMKLITLKNIFSKQLPKMPKDYIVRLVFDKRHISLAIKKNSRIIGGICYRPYNEQRFGEIAFCAVSSQEQVRGFGTKLMNQLKYVAQRTGMEYFLTYADNYATGYFQKQGFSKHISMPKERWVGFIKDYDGGTLMECYVHPGINYLDVNGIVTKQRKFILERLQENSRSSAIYPGLTVFQEGKKLQNVLDLPGVAEAKWSSLSVYRGTTERDRTMSQSKLHGQLKNLFDKLRGHKSCRQLLSFDVIEDPNLPSWKRLNFERVCELLRSGDYYRSKEALGAELLRMADYYRKLLLANNNAQEIINSFTGYVKEIFLDMKESSANVEKENTSSSVTTAN